MPLEQEMNSRKKRKPRKEKGEHLSETMACFEYRYYLRTKSLVFFAFVSLRKSFRINLSSLNSVYMGCSTITHIL